MLSESSRRYNGAMPGNMGLSDLPRELSVAIDRIRNDRIHGATFLARDAVRIMTLAARKMPSGGEYISTLNQLAERLAATRPAMAGIKNMVERYMSLVRSAGGYVEPGALEVRLLEEMDRASERASAGAAKLIRDGDVVISCSYSSTVLRALRMAREAGKTIRVVALESRSGDVAYGRNFVQGITSLGVTGRVVCDDSAAAAVQDADLALVGADKLLPDGSVVNGRSSGLLAEAARGVIPFYVVCEEFKRDSDPSVEEGFELVSAALITAVITEDK